MEEGRAKREEARGRRLEGGIWREAGEGKSEESGGEGREGGEGRLGEGSQSCLSGNGLFSSEGKEEVSRQDSIGNSIICTGENKTHIYIYIYILSSPSKLWERCLIVSVQHVFESSPENVFK